MTFRTMRAARLTGRGSYLPPAGVRQMLVGLVNLSKK
jgi:hypothetical protein